MSRNTGAASVRSMIRSGASIIWVRELASSVLLAPAKARVSESYSAINGAAPSGVAA